jgi:hypothetical protein
MKVISYNTHTCTQAKIDHILAMGADLFILPECSSREHVSIPAGYDMLWCGDDDLKEKGLGVVLKKHLSVRIIPEYKKIKHILPLMVDSAGFPKFVLASWPTVWMEKKTYPQLLLEALKEYSFYLVRFPSMVVGDFNCFVGQSGVSKTTGTFEDCIAEMEKHGLRSIYHEQTGESFGKETTATFYWHFNPEKPFFLDYAFSCIKPSSFAVGEWEREISDHRPLIIDLDDEPWDGRP